MEQTFIALAMAIYVACLFGISIYFSRRAQASTEEYFLGGRSLGPWVTAMSAEASDMSGWLLMGLPGLAYWTGFADAFWTAFGLALGTYINWLIVARRLRIYSHIAGNAITLPDFLSNRFNEEKRVIMTVSALLILVFFTVYCASCFVTIGKLFSTLFHLPYFHMMLIGAVFVLAFTLIGGFLGAATSDLLQATLMVTALVLVLALGVHAAGGPAQVVENAKEIPGFFEFFGLATPHVVDGKQVVEAGVPLFDARSPYSLLSVVSMLSWGLGYFGVPQVLVRFMAIRNSEEIRISRRIATIWVCISLASAVAIGMVGRIAYPTLFTTASTAENIFIALTTSLIPPFIAGFVMAGILAATISSSDAYLLIAASAISKNIYQRILNRDASDKEVMRISRLVLFLIAIVAIVLASNEHSVIFNIVSFAWAGFGASFGPVIILALFWRNATAQGALAGMLAGGATVCIWNWLESSIGGIFTVYELLPAFLVALAVNVIVSLFTQNKHDTLAQFEQYVQHVCGNI